MRIQGKKIVANCCYKHSYTNSKCIETSKANLVAYTQRYLIMGGQIDPKAVRHQS